MSKLLLIIPALFASGGLIAIVRGVYQSIPRGHQATKTRNGAPVRIKPPRLFFWRRKNFDFSTVGEVIIYNPGKPTFKIPFVEEILVRRVNGQNLALQTKTVLGDFTVYTIDSFLRFVTVDVVKYTYDNEHPRTALRNKAEELLLRRLSGCCYTDMQRIHEIADEVKQQLGEFASELGIQLKDFGINTYDPSPSCEKMIQMASQTTMGVAASEEAARLLGYASARDMGPSWAAVIQSSALPSIATSGKIADLVDEFDEDASARQNGNVVALPH